MTDPFRRRHPSELTADELSVYEAITGGRRSDGPSLFDLQDEDGALLGPFNAMLFSPSVGMALQNLGSELRYSSALSDRARELVILMVADRFSSAFERDAHLAVGKAVGLTAQEMFAVAQGRVPKSTTLEERSALELAALLLDGGVLDERVRASAAECLGTTCMFEVSCLVGYYSLLAVQMRLFGVDAGSCDVSVMEEVGLACRSVQ